MKKLYIMILIENTIVVVVLVVVVVVVVVVGFPVVDVEGGKWVNRLHSGRYHT